MVTKASWLRLSRCMCGRWPPDHTSTLDTVYNLGNLYGEQGKLAEAEQMYVRALAGKEKMLGT